MQAATVKVAKVNVEMLDAELRTALESKVLGIRWNGADVTAVLVDDATPEQISRVHQIIEQHDPASLSPRQQAEIERRERLEQLRADNAGALDEAAYAGDPAMQKLARRVAWLEQEMLALRREA